MMYWSSIAFLGKTLYALVLTMRQFWWASTMASVAFVKKEDPNVFVLGAHVTYCILQQRRGLVSCHSRLLIFWSRYTTTLKNPAKRQKFKEVQSLCCIENHAILKHVRTRWLSLQKSLDRLLEQWAALVEYFHREQLGGERRPSEGLSCSLPPPPRNKNLQLHVLCQDQRAADQTLQRRRNWHQSLLMLTAKYNKDPTFVSWRSLFFPKCFYSPIYMRW